MGRCKGLHESWSRLASAKSEDWYILLQGKFAKICRHVFERPPRKHSPKTAISGFTPAARMRLLKWIAKVDWPEIASSRFITLTYPDALAETTYKDRAVHRYLFLRMLEQYVNHRVATLWRTEWINRLSGKYKGYLIPHHHLLVMRCGYIPNSVVRNWWQGILRYDDTISTDVKAVPEHAAASYYVAKYTSKLLHLDIAPYLNKMLMTGRQWGVTRRDLVPMCQMTSSRMLTDGEIELAKALGRELFSRYGEFGEGGFTLLGERNLARLQEIFGNALAPPEEPV